MPADSVNKTSFLTHTLTASSYRKPPDKTVLAAQSRPVRETDLNTIQGYIVKQEYPISQQNPRPHHSFLRLFSQGDYSLPQRISYFSM